MNDETLKIILLAIIVIVAIIIKVYEPRIKGKYGEAKVATILSLLSSKNYKIINDLLISNNTRSSQIDHIVISTYGIFVIETKNYKGWIFGHEKSNSWTQILYKNKYKLRNPVLQCWGHINTLKTVLPDLGSIPYYPIVVFTGSAKLKKITSEVPVIYSYQLLRSISKHSTKEHISNDEIDQIYQKLIRFKGPDKVARKTHVSKAKSISRKNVKSTTCPRCGGSLTSKNGKHGMFYGCSNFPKCKFTKNDK